MRLSRLIGAACILTALLALAPALRAQSTKSALQTQIANCFPNQTTGAITPPITATCFNALVASFQQYAGVNAQTTTSYTFLPSDYGQLVTFNSTTAVSATMPQAISPSFFPWNAFIKNNGAGTVNLLPIGSTVNSAATLQLSTGQSAWLVSDGANYQVWNLGGGQTVLVMPTTDGQNFLFQNGTKAAYANIYGPAAPAGLFDYDNIRSVIDLESSTTVQNYNAYGAWIWNNVATTVTSGITFKVGVGLETYCVNAIAGAECVGLNPAITDSFDGTIGHSVASTLIGAESDFTTDNSGSAVQGLSMVLQGLAQPASAGGIVMSIQTSSTAQWTGGLTIFDGALAAGNAGIVLGTIGSANGINLSSDPITFNITDTTSTKHHIDLGGAASGLASELVITDVGLANGIGFITAATTSSPQIAAFGSDSNINLKIVPKGTTGGTQIFGGNSSMFDCNITNSGFCTVTASSGLAMGGHNIVQGAVIDSNSASGYRLLAATASATQPTIVPNNSNAAALHSGIGADAAGDVSIIADNAGTATEAFRATGTQLQFKLGAVISQTTIGSLPGCNGTTDGMFFEVTNGITPVTYGGGVSVTGTTHDLVFCNGSVWAYH